MENILSIILLDFSINALYSKYKVLR